MQQKKLEYTFIFVDFDCLQAQWITIENPKLKMSSIPEKHLAPLFNYINRAFHY